MNLYKVHIDYKVVKLKSLLSSGIKKPELEKEKIVKLKSLLRSGDQSPDLKNGKKS
jgi:hypothetical protein